jgi:hypothetical protein
MYYICILLLAQVIKSYTNDDCEEPIKAAFVEQLQKKLIERNEEVRVLVRTFFQMTHIKMYVSLF